MPKTIIENLMEIRRLAEAKTMERIETDGDGGADVIPKSNSCINYLTFTPLLEVVREECSHCSGDGCDEVGGYCVGCVLDVGNHPNVDGIYPLCQECQGTGYVLRNWSCLPQGALAGCLKVAMLHFLPLLGQSPNMWSFGWDIIDCLWNSNPDLVATEMVLEAMREEESLERGVCQIVGLICESGCTRYERRQNA